ncbi:hypothetical protein HPB52_019966 [Rhipicephalus sanguineus]|uniref:Protein kinase domain-containing protein n=1 Tax=Rhipicephalus sanguineus TaxID=34632 RepID=A0A9D4PS90_RHISA|nr:hypothetical protein HPB52_019966 [Rhipicephalus sanguineus]
MPRKLRESMSPQQREVYRDFQQQPSAFANSRRYCIPREKMHDPEVRASLLDYVRSVIEQAVDCAKVISTCALRDSQSRPNTLHKWDPKASVRNVPPPPMLNLPTVTLDRVRSRDEMETDTTAGSHGPRRGLRSPTMRFLSRLIPGRHSQSHAGSFSQSVCEKDEERSHMTMSMRSKPSSWKTLSIFSQIVEKPRLESLREWSFSRIVVIDILRTRKQDLVCSARHTFSGEWAILKIVWKRRFSSSLLEEGALRDDVIVNIVANVTYALKYIHDRDMMYRNISPTTILIDMKGTARLFDFAFCSHGKTSSSRIGSIPYMAPEVLRMEVYDRTSDYWSLGILTYVLYVRHTPMSIYSAKTNLDHWADRDYMYQYAEVVPIILPKHMPPHAKSLICGLLVERPRLRLGCRSTGFYEVMKHPFFHHVDWDSFTSNTQRCFYWPSRLLLCWDTLPAKPAMEGMVVDPSCARDRPPAARKRLSSSVASEAADSESDVKSDDSEAFIPAKHRRSRRKSSTSSSSEETVI